MKPQEEILQESWKRYVAAQEEVWSRKDAELDECCRKLDAEKLEFSEWKQEEEEGASSLKKE